MKAIHFDIEETYENQVYKVHIKNPVDCPMRFLLSSEIDSINEILEIGHPILLEAKADTLLVIRDKGDLKEKIDFDVKFGNPQLPILTNKLDLLPYPKGKSYKLMQGNNSTPTHNTNNSRYAFDFTLKIGDTITASQEGYVIYKVDGYKGWGTGNKWKSYGNQVIIYNPRVHLFTAYGHLKQHGSFVDMGDYIEAGQPIALSGKTGQTTEEHLHFNVYRADNSKNGLTSYPLDSIGNYKVKELERYQWMKN